MGYSYNKAMALRPQKERWLSTFFIALACAGVMFVPFMILDHGYFTFFGDFNVQQIPFYQMCHAAVKSGNIGWNWLTDLGSDFISSYTFYLLGSPFFWLTMPFPNSIVPYLIGPLLILKFACAALTAYFYIRRFTRTPEAARLGAMLYAFSGFSVYNIFFNHFHEAIIIFPLLLLSFELILTENRHGLFALCVFLSAGINYFFFYGMVIFAVIYFIIRLCSGAIRLSVGRFFLIILEAAIGVAATSFILLPTVMTLLSNQRLSSITLGWGAIMYGNEQIYLNIFECFFFPPDLPARPIFFPNADVKWASLGGWLPLVGMTGVFAFCGNNKGHWLKRVICTCIVFALFPVLNASFTMFNTCYYARWFFMPVLMMCLATVMAFEQRDVKLGSALRWTAFITLAFVAVIGLFPKKQNGNIVFGLFTDAGSSELYTARFWITSALAIVSVIIMIVLSLVFKKRTKDFFNVTLALVCVASMVYGIIFIFGGREHSYDQEKVVIGSLIEGKVDLPGDKDSYRIDTYECPDNTGMFLGYSSINAFHSIVPDSIIEFYDFIGEERSVASRPTTKSEALRDLLSVKYLLNLKDEAAFEDENGTKMDGYNYLTTQSNFKIYENENYIPYGFAYDKYISMEDCARIAGSDIPNVMLKAVVLDPEQIQKYSGVMEPLDLPDYYDFTEEVIKEDCDNLRATCAQTFKVENGKFTANVASDKTVMYFFSVPYEEGWSATVNGKPAEIIKANVGFMAVMVDAGSSEIVFTYKTPYLDLGIKVSIGALAVFIIYMIICIATRKHRKAVSYPEGEALIERYTEYDVADMMESQQEENDTTSLDKIAEELGKKYPTPDNGGIQGFVINTDD